MADPISILGLVASVLTFADFGWKVVVGGKSARHSVDGTTDDVTRLNAIIADIRRLNSTVTA
jgi:hypothetical protein